MQVWGLSKSIVATLTGVCASVLTANTAWAENPRDAYNEPTRGFFIEHGIVAGQGKVSAELHTGSGDIEVGGGVRLGLPNSELIVSSGIREQDTTEAKLKWGLNKVVKAGRSSTNARFDWAALVGIAHTDNENANGQTTVDQTKLSLGAALTINVDAATFTLAPELVYADGNLRDDTYIDVALGAYVGIIDTPSGLFSMGVEGLFTSADNADNAYAVGGRWAYNERVNLDFVPLIFSDGDRIGFPGLVRLNVTL